MADLRIKRTSTPNSPPADGSLAPGELAVEMDLPTRLWVGVPVAQDATGKKLLIDTSASGGLDQATADGLYVNIAGDTMTGALSVANGTALLPGLSFAPEVGTGWYMPGLGALRATIAGVDNIQYTQANITSFVPMVVEGNVTIDKTVDGTLAGLTLKSNVGVNASIIMNTDALARWILRKTTDAETGVNAGSNFEIAARDDAGAIFTTPLIINRATGIVAMPFGATLENGAPAGKRMHTADTPPTAPADGDLWWHSNLGKTLTWYTDANGSQWVEV